jgi:hypothetical protein
LGLHREWDRAPLVAPVAGVPRDAGLASDLTDNVKDEAKSASS